MRAPFLFSTGIENGYPLLANGHRVDEMEQSGHHARWREDFGLAREIGARALRYGPAYYRTHVGPSKYDWSSADEPLNDLRDQGIELIADLCRFGVPTWLGGFQDPAFPVLFAEYARAFARRYPWVRYYTPVSEIFISASFSALRGLWNEALADEGAFAKAMRNLCMGHELAVEAILAERPDAVIIQSESIEHFHPVGKRTRAQAARESAFKHLALDLTLGRSLPPGMGSFLNEHGVTSNDLSFFREKRGIGQRWLGIDFRGVREQRVPSSENFPTPRNAMGCRLLPAEYYSTHRTPLFHGETDRVGPDAVEWLSAQWEDVTELRAAGIPVFGFLWFSLTDRVNPQHGERPELRSGLYDRGGQIRPVGVAYKDLIAANEHLAASTVSPREKEA
ncbi:MAG TPA: family 1 glycosylhydrolase [Gemmatimonadaceae bacterium]|nr:family 1 glycosylhydrolase [Gemmatimonadaceae bacterium]